MKPDVLVVTFRFMCEQHSRGLPGKAHVWITDERAYELLCEVDGVSRVGITSDANFYKVSIDARHDFDEVTAAIAALGENGEVRDR